MNDKEINKYVGMKIKEFRKEKKLTQKELADLVGIKNSAISNYEQGVRIPKRDFLFKVANSLNVSIDEFFPNQNRIIPSSTLSEINKINAQLSEQRQNNVLQFSKNQLEEQNHEVEKEKILALDKMDTNDDGIDWNEWVAFDGKPMTDHDKQVLKDYFGDDLKD